MPSISKTGCLVVVLLGVHGGLLAWSAHCHSPTIDEPAHLAAGINHWQYGRFDLYSVNPPLVRMVAALPVLLARPMVPFGEFRPADQTRAEFRVGDAFSDANGPRIFRLVMLARWACIPFSVLGAWVCFRWASRMFGAACGLTALALWCFSPTVLAHAAKITADVPAAALGITAAYLFWNWLREPRLSTAFPAGVALGMALLVKSTLILFCVLWPVIWWLYRWSAGAEWTRHSVRRELGCGTLMLATALTIINLGYGFEGSFQPLAKYDFRSSLLAGGSAPDRESRWGNRFRGSIIGNCPLPLPANYVLGIDHQRCDFEEPRRKFFLGEMRTDDGWWYFYLYAMAVKEPLGVWLLALLALPIAFRRRLCDQLVLLMPAAAILALVSSQAGLNFYRYLLPALPFAVIWISQAARHLAARAWLPRLVYIGAGAWMIGSSLWVYPHSLSYFNELVGGPRNGHRIIIDSNTDWGQDLLFLKEWIDRHPSARGLRLNYYGVVDPELAGLAVSDVENIAKRQDRHRYVSLWDQGQPQWYAVSVTHLIRGAVQVRNGSGSEDAGGGSRFYRFLLDQQPDATAGYSIFIYRIGRNAPRDGPVR